MRGALFFLVALASSALGCDKDPGSAQAIAVARPSAGPSGGPVAPAGAEVPKPPWFSGRWSADFVVEAHPIEMTRAEGAVSEWSKDEKKVGVGPAKLELEVSAGGDVTGKATGALGDLEVRGRAGGEELRAELSAHGGEPAKTFAGVVLASRSGEKLEGKLQASTGDSLLVRRAELVLKQVDGRSPGAPAPAASAR